jgi:hypothetical protein
LTGGLTYYFVLWSGDEVPNWSTISNTTSTIPVIPLRSVTITSGSSQAFGVVMMGSQVVGTTGTVVTNDGNLVNTYALRASTLTVGSPWQILSSTPAGPDQLVFYGVFDGASAPGLGSFDVDDVIGPWRIFGPKALPPTTWWTKTCMSHGANGFPLTPSLFFPWWKTGKWWRPLR